MRIELVTLFPEMFTALGEYGVSGRALKNGLVSLGFNNPRDFASDRHRTVDDKPYGGGPGMLMKTGPLSAAIAAARDRAQQAGNAVRVAYLSPQGMPLTQAIVAELAQRPAMVLVCGRYQGVDQRVLDTLIEEEWSLGDFVISGGELAAMALLDAMIRLQPGALGDEDSADQDSFARGLLHWPEYTRPAEFEGQAVPAVLLGGDHEAIRRWRLQQSLGVTWHKRPDLLAAIELDTEQQELLRQYQEEFYKQSSRHEPGKRE
ncbi:MAG: tRNA (guanosine(37)-N1)-methyltransferase TrmD [Gammaproteobacteria bacterium]